MADPNIPQVPLQDNFNLRNDSILAARLAMAKVIYGVAGTRCKYVFHGDSNFVGTNGNNDTNTVSTTSPATWFMYYLNKFGCPAQQDNTFAVSSGAAAGATGAIADTRIVWQGAAAPNYGLTCLGGSVVVMSASGDGVLFTINAAAVYDHVDIWYYDGTGSFNVYLNGGSTSIQTITTTNTGNILSVSVAFTSQSITSVGVKWVSGTLYIAAFDLWNNANPSVEVINAGVGGTASNLLIPTATTGCSPWAGLIALAPTLIYSNYSVNDFNNGTYTPTQVTANYKAGATAFQGYGYNFWPIIAAPYGSSAYPTQTNLWRPMMHELCLQMDLPLCDWSNRYGENYGVVGNPSNLHSPYYLYKDIGRRLAQLLFYSG